MKNTERFSGRVENYVRYRPHYPKEIITFLKKSISFTDQWIVADIGSGSGISSELFLKNGNVVMAIEPNQEMRAAAEAQFKKKKKFISLKGTAENTTLPENSVDLIVAGQAFHWFNQRKSKKEFQRISTPNGYLLLMWNERDMNSPVQKAYHQMLLELAPKYEEVCQQNINEKAIKSFFSPNPFTFHSIPQSQFFDLEGFKGRLFSTSYAPIGIEKEEKILIKRLKKIFDQFNVNGLLEFPYHCKIYCGKIGSK